MRKWHAKKRAKTTSIPPDGPAVDIRVGSIHSAKGETHTATLVLDTFFYDHHLRALRPWLLGQRLGQGTEGPRMCSRLKQHYVAFTRPTHLLAIAMRMSLPPRRSRRSRTETKEKTKHSKTKTTQNKKNNQNQTRCFSVRCST